MTLSLRTPTPEDYEWALACHHAAYRDVIIRTYGIMHESVQDGYFGRSWNAIKHEILYWDGQKCGYVAVQDRPNDAKNVSQFSFKYEIDGRMGEMTVQILDPDENSDTPQLPRLKLRGRNGIAVLP